MGPTNDSTSSELAKLIKEIVFLAFSLASILLWDSVPKRFQSNASLSLHLVSNQLIDFEPVQANLPRILPENVFLAACRSKLFPVASSQPPSDHN